jgi:hypothetical protein
MILSASLGANVFAETYSGYSTQRDNSSNTMELPTAVEPAIGDSMSLFSKTSERGVDAYNDDWTDLRSRHIYGSF